MSYAASFDSPQRIVLTVKGASQSGALI